MSITIASKFVTTALRKNILRAGGATEIAMSRLLSSTTTALSSNEGQSSTNNLTTRRSLSTQGQQAVGRFQEAIEEYRQNNYTQTIQPRFKKELLGAIHTKTTTSGSDETAIAVEQIEDLLRNIGARVAKEDVETIVSELGGRSENAKTEVSAKTIVAQLVH